MGFGGWKELIVVSVTGSQIRNRQSRESSGAVNTIILLLSGVGVMQLEIRKVGCCMTGDTIADPAGRRFGRWRGERRWFRQEHLQTGEFCGAEPEGLRVKLELSIRSVGIGCHELWREARCIDQCPERPAIG